MLNLESYLTLSPGELQSASKVKLEVMPGAAALYVQFARALADEIQANNRTGRPTRVILPVGPVGQYPILAQICNQERISWKQVFTFNMDEYCDWQGRAVPVDHPLSFRRAMRDLLFDRLDEAVRIPDDHVHFPDPLNLDQLSRDILAVGGIDTCYGGVGYHGHIAFNEPPISRWYKLTAQEFRNSLTRIVPLAPETVVMNSSRGAGGHTAALPPMAATMGMHDILQARRIRLYCPGGAWQRFILRVALFGAEDVDYPVTLLQGHPDYAIVADLDTAAPPIAAI